MDKKYIGNKHFITIKDGKQTDNQIEIIEIDENDPIWLIQAKVIFNSIISEDYYSVIADFDKQTYMMTIA